MTVGVRASTPTSRDVHFSLETGIPLLSRTPIILDVLLRDLPDRLITGTEGPDTWSPFDVLGHLIHGERTDWVPRVEHLLAHGESVPFPAFDRFAQFEASRGKALPELLDEFSDVRFGSITRLAALDITDSDLERTGRHPELGVVTLGQHLATWVVHDLDHLVQIGRVMGKQYAEAVGPWRQYLRIVGEQGHA